ncbi:hypothetical protein KRX51_09460 [Corynebacterium sp. TAE3-ERU12]|uniref:hypothetical protein n=1 Tax=Corynebacterium sp. TAE3-ERU12 TaxID=2849491 RepID=UPI001C462795|nr:hypothetical protein [Corynebacterium sp. TAE3-ERU12]MBV7296136.1 hypothetical protein [Corynebacterium sp. TAE3-ERU12]
MTNTTNSRIALAVLGTSALMLGACSSDEDTKAAETATDAVDQEDHDHEGHDHDGDDHEGHDHEDGVGEGASLPEVSAPEPRVAISYDGGVLVLDGGDLQEGENPEVLDEFDADGFLRLNPAGDGRHVFVSTEDKFKVLDIGSYRRAHGDHFHHYAGDPSFTDFEVDAKEPGHVVGGKRYATLFDDKSGQVTDVRLTGMAVTDQFEVPAHHGIAVRGEDDTYMVTLSDDEGDRIGVAQYDAEGKELKRFEECEGAHGAAEAGKTVLVGCVDGALLYKDGEVTKVKSPDEYGRIASEFTNEDGRFVLTDYDNDKEAADKDERALPNKVAIVDVKDEKMNIIDLGDVNYSFRSLAMAEDNTAVVLGTDGKLHLIDPEEGEITKSIDVLDKWEVPEDWQEGRPAVSVAGMTAYVTDPENKKLYVIDLTGKDDTLSVELPETPSEIIATQG